MSHRNRSAINKIVNASFNDPGFDSKCQLSSGGLFPREKKRRSTNCPGSCCKPTEKLNPSIAGGSSSNTHND